MVKDRDEVIQRVTSDLDALLTPIEESKASPAQYNQAINYLKWVNSDNFEDKEKALGFMMQEVKALAVMLGRPVPGINFLEGHDDLIQAVGTGQITQKHAMELAVNRERDKRSRQIVTERAQANEQAQTTQQIHQQAVADLNSLGKELAASDPQYAAKFPAFKQALSALRGRVAPEHWVAAARDIYRAIPAAAAAPRPSPTPSIPNNQPLRAVTGASKPVTEPKSALDALNAGIAQAG